MLTGVTSTPRIPPRPAIRAGGGVQFTAQGDVQVKKSVLGFIPVSVTVDVGDILAGKYGREFKLDFASPTEARLQGHASYGIFSQDIDDTLRMRGGSVLKTLEVRIQDDERVRFQGSFKLFGYEIPFNALVRPMRQDHKTFRFEAESLQIGQGGFQLPGHLAAWGASIVLNVFGGMRGIKAVSGKQLEVDFSQVRLPQKTGEPKPAPQPRPVDDAMPSYG